MLIRNSKILVTGAAGSIGSALAMRLYKMKPKELILVDQDETGIFYISGVMRGAHCLVGDVTNKESIARIFEQYRPEIVFHCAAYKHVPIMELQKEEAIENNVYGTRNIIELAHEYGARKFVLLSTDKAVNPSSVMGKTKRICELMCLAQDSGCDYIIVRFGNVTRSRGSVVETFEKLIKEGKPLEITHPDMSRYFISMQDAVSILLKASQGNNRELYVWNMHDPIKITDLAKNLCEKEGKEPNIKFCGLRPGEKISEELFYPDEKPKKRGKYFVVQLKSELIDLNNLINEI
jgi:FlaA1/EpsC-like NDP-sugar epimerase